jgi:hypothetical protein
LIVVPCITAQEGCMHALQLAFSTRVHQLIQNWHSSLLVLLIKQGVTGSQKDYHWDSSYQFYLISTEGIGTI